MQFKWKRLPTRHCGQRRIALFLAGYIDVQGRELQHLARIYHPEVVAVTSDDCSCNSSGLVLGVRKGCLGT